MNDADALRTIAGSTAVSGFIPTLSEVLMRAADALEQQDAMIIAQTATIAALEAAVRDKG